GARFWRRGPVSPNWHLGSRYSHPFSVPVPTAGIPKHTILQQRHTRTGAEEKDKVEVQKCMPQELAIQVHLEALSTGKGAMMKALVDSGCTNCFMDLEWVKRMGLEPSPLQTPITMYNMDGTQNRNGKIQYGIDLLVMVGDHREWIHFLLGKTQPHMVILGHDWLKRHNPEIDWVKAEVKLIRCPSPCSSSPRSHLTPAPLKTSTLASASI